MHPEEIERQIGPTSAAAIDNDIAIPCVRNLTQARLNLIMWQIDSARHVACRELLRRAHIEYQEGSAVAVLLPLQKCLRSHKTNLRHSQRSGDGRG